MEAAASVVAGAPEEAGEREEAMEGGGARRGGRARVGSSAQRRRTQRARRRRTRRRARPEGRARHTTGAEAHEGVAQDPIRRLIPRRPNWPTVFDRLIDYMEITHIYIEEYMGLRRPTASPIGEAQANSNK